LCGGNVRCAVRHGQDAEGLDSNRASSAQMHVPQWSVHTRATGAAETVTPLSLVRSGGYQIRNEKSPWQPRHGDPSSVLARRRPRSGVPSPCHPIVDQQVFIVAVLSASSARVAAYRVAARCAFALTFHSSGACDADACRDLRTCRVRIMIRKSFQPVEASAASSSLDPGSARASPRNACRISMLRRHPSGVQRRRERFSWKMRAAGAIVISRVRR
jgi:hypothetical protein